MRYYRYGTEESKHDVERKESKPRKLLGHFGELIIDEDTIYELDEECLQCQREKKK